MGGRRVPRWRQEWKDFADYRAEGSRWITAAKSHFFPDYLPLALDRHEPAIAHFKTLLETAVDSHDLFRRIMTSSEPGVEKIALVRIFRRYVSPEAPVEILKRTKSLEQTLKDFGETFRPLGEVRQAFATRPLRDEALGAVLWEHQERGKPGAALTETFFEWVRENLEGIDVRGGRDIPLSSVFGDYPKARGVDFVMSDPNGVVAVGLLHYDSDRGGAQEADRVGQYREAAEEIVQYLQRGGEATKLIFINDGPGLLAGAMWRRYAELEKLWPYKIQVNTIKMLKSRLTLDWLYS